jgi:hypothetical protein
MTTAFTAIPIKMTTSAIRFFGNAMTEFYPGSGAAFIDPDQVRWSFQGR